MFCPNCGYEERQTNQFCRACGANLRIVRSALEKPDNITDAAVTAREEIGRAVAAKIRETESVRELKKVAEDVLPEIEKFLESPEEKRMRRIRTGTIIASVGAGAAIAFALVSIFTKEDVEFLAGMGLVAFFVGLGFILNGLYFTVPRKSLSDNSAEADRQRELDRLSNVQANALGAPTSELVLPEAKSLFSSVTEETTQHLKEKVPIERK